MPLHAPHPSSHISTQHCLSSPSHCRVTFMFIQQNSPSRLNCSRCYPSHDCRENAIWSTCWSMNTCSLLHMNWPFPSSECTYVETRRNLPSKVKIQHASSSNFHFYAFRSNFYRNLHSRTKAQKVKKTKHIHSLRKWSQKVPKTT